MDWYPHATVATVVEQNGRFLLVEEQAEGGIVFNQPAGHIEPNETFQQAAIRETLEETGWQVTPQSLVGFYVYRSANNGVTYHRACFHASAVQHYSERPLDDGIIAAHWLTRDEVVARQSELRSPMVLQCIDDYLQGKRFPLDLIVEQNV